MKLISGRLSLFAKKVEIALAEKRLTFERDFAPFSQTKGYSPKHPEVVAINPKLQVPVLIDGDLKLYDSTVIIEYLEDAFPSPALFPKAPREKARCRQLELYGDEIILAAVRPLMHRNEPGGKERAEWAAREAAAQAAEAEYARCCARIDDELGAKWLCGDFSAADIAVFLPLFYGQRLGAPSMKPYPALWDWYRRVKSRPTVAAVVAETLEADAELSAPVDGAFKDDP